ncbi:MAG: HAMP domain-containing histidine kinase [Alkalibacterium sp.]|nr:HAMP domain-containing histidine kinase [Alkalibacterium sp.]
MKLPYFYQQFLGFLAVIIILMTVTVISLVIFGRNSAFQSIENRLFQYAESISDENMDNEDLMTIQKVLMDQEVSFFVFDERGSLLYPTLPAHIEARVVPDHEDRLRSGEEFALRTEQEDMLGNPREIVLVHRPYFDNETEDYDGFVTVSAPISHIDQQMADLKANLFNAFLISTILAVVMSFIFARYQVNRINRLRKAAHLVAEGEYSIKLDHKERDEIDYLSRDFNRMIDALKQSREEVNRQEERRKTFMQDAAHEMRTPLTTVNGILEGLEHDVIPESQKLRSIKLMRKETRRLIRLVNENMDYENIRSNRIVLNKQSIPLDELLEEIQEQMKDIVTASTNTLVIEQVKGKSVLADYDRIKQILVNLIKNAIQFTENGTIKVYASQNEAETKICIEDTGIGMTDEELRFIWDRYYKADNSRVNTKYGESGLGLAIVKQLVDLHDAEITVESTPNEGTRFTLVFPIPDSSPDVGKMN